MDALVVVPEIELAADAHERWRERVARRAGARVYPIPPRVSRRPELADEEAVVLIVQPLIGLPLAPALAVIAVDDVGARGCRDTRGILHLVAQLERAVGRDDVAIGVDVPGADGARAPAPRVAATRHAAQVKAARPPRIEEYEHAVARFRVRGRVRGRDRRHGVVMRIDVVDGARARDLRPRAPRRLTVAFETGERALLERDAPAANRVSALRAVRIQADAGLEQHTRRPQAVRGELDDLHRSPIEVRDDGEL